MRNHAELLRGAALICGKGSVKKIGIRGPLDGVAGVYLAGLLNRVKIARLVVTMTFSEDRSAGARRASVRAGCSGPALNGVANLRMKPGVFVRIDMTTNFEIELVRRIQRGDDRALGVVFSKHSSVIFSVGFRVLGDTVAAEEVLHNVLMRLRRSPDSFVASRLTLRQWLTLDARIHALRLRGAHPASSPAGGDVPVPFAAKPATRLFKGPALVKPERLLEMAFFEGKTPEEIGQITGLSTGSVKRGICHALMGVRNSSPVGGQPAADA